MKIEIDIPATLVDDVMANYPEASACLTCISYNYKACRFEFWDHEVTADDANKSIVPATVKDVELSRSGLVRGAVIYVLDRAALDRGMEILLRKVFAGELRGLSLNGGNVTDPGAWDMWCADALVQCAVFGEVIYG